MNRITRFIRFAVSLALAFLMGAEPALARLAYAASPIQEMPVSLPPQIGWLTDSFSIRKDNTRPDVILIQDLHVNRSVQFAISKLLGYLASLNLLPETIAIEGSTGPVDVSGLQQMGSPKERKKAADYLVEQGEMPGDVHYVVTQGKGKLYGVEDTDSYQGILTTYQKTYEARTNLMKVLVKAEKAIQRLKRRGESDTVKQNAMMLEVDIQALKKLLAHEVTPDDLKPTVQRMLQSLPRLEKVLPQDDIKELALSVSGSVNFYTLALMRDESMHKNLLKLRKLEKQQTSILVVGGFHTPGLTKQLKKDGLSYWVITPNIKRHTKVDEKLYVERMMGRHLTPEQVAKGYDWSALLAKPFYSIATMTSQLAAGIKSAGKSGILGLVLVGSIFLPNSISPVTDVTAQSDSDLRTKTVNELGEMATKGTGNIEAIRALGRPHSKQNDLDDARHFLHNIVYTSRLGSEMRKVAINTLGSVYDQYNKNGLVYRSDDLTLSLLWESSNVEFLIKAQYTDREIIKYYQSILNALENSGYKFERQKLNETLTLMINGRPELKTRAQAIFNGLNPSTRGSEVKKYLIPIGILSFLMLGGDITAFAQTASEITTTAAESGNGWLQGLATFLMFLGLVFTPLIVAALQTWRDEKKGQTQSLAIAPLLGLPVIDPLAVASLIGILILAGMLASSSVQGVFAYIVNYQGTKKWAQMVLEKLDGYPLADIRTLSAEKFNELAKEADALIPSFMKNKNQEAQLKAMRAAILAAA